MIHIIDQATCERTPLAATLAADVCRAVNEAAGERRHRTLVLGRAEAAEEAGLEPDEVIACPRDALVPGGVAAMRRWVKEKGRILTPLPQVGERLGEGDEPEDSAYPCVSPSLQPSPWKGEGETGPVVCWSAGCEMLMSLVMAETLRIMPGDAHRAIDARRLVSADRMTLRERWGVSDGERVVVLLCDQPGEADADQALIAAGLAAETGRPWRLLLHPEAKNLSMAQHVTRQMGHAGRIILDRRVAVTWRVLPGCDAAIWLTPGTAPAPGSQTSGMSSTSGGGGLALVWAMMSGVPIVAEPHDWLAHDATAWIGRTGRSRTLASLLCRVYDQPGDAKRLGEAAWADAKRRFDPAQAAAWWMELS
ncbi:MAG: glycosyltransferase [Phycisphaerales bacterium]